jgi:hypothetical protein
VEREPDPERRAAYRYFALTFAELIPELVNWQRALEGWQVHETQLSKQIKHQGEVARAQVMLIEGLGLRMKSSVPEPIRLAIEGTNELDTLDRWFRALFEVDSWADFQNRMKQG